MTGSPAVLSVRYDDLDLNGHVAGSAYLAYADHARWELMRSAGVFLEAFAGAGVGPVNLETTIRFRKELRPGDKVEVRTAFSYGSKTGGARQQLYRAGAGELVAEVTSVTGLLDLRTRRLVEDHGSRIRGLTPNPSVIGL